MDHDTLPETHNEFTPANRRAPKRNEKVFQPSIFRCKLSVSKVVSTHPTGTHPEQPLPTGYNGIPFIVGERGIAERVCDIGVCCNFLGLLVSGRVSDRSMAVSGSPKRW